MAREETRLIEPREYRGIRVQKDVKPYGKANAKFYAKFDAHEGLRALNEAKDLGFVGWPETVKDDGWTGGFTLAQAKKWAVFGDGSSVKSLNAILSKIATAMGDTLQETTEPTPYGPIWEMPEFLAGVPLCGRGFMETPQRDRVIKIMLCTFVSGSVSAEAVQRRARAVAALAAALDMLGFPIEVILSVTYEPCDGPYQDEGCMMEITAHRSGGSFDLARVAFLCGHVAAIRFYVYSLESLLCQVKRGSCVSRSLDADVKATCEREGWVYVPACVSGDEEAWGTTDEDAVKWVLETVAKVTAPKGKE